MLVDFKAQSTYEKSKLKILFQGMFIGVECLLHEPIKNVKSQSDLTETVS